MTAARQAGIARVGIDFGTSSTVAVLASPHREPRPLLFDGSPLLPSAVCLDPTGRVLVGRDAYHTAMSMPEAFEPYPKQRVDDESVLLGGTEVAVSRLYRAVLERVVAEARHAVGQAAGGPMEVVLTCPVAWGQHRRATLLAAAPAGARLVDEPVAAAHHFGELAGVDITEGRTAVVYDLGAGTFDAALVRRTATGFDVVAAEGVADCGGLDIDAAIVRHLTAAVGDSDVWQRLDRPATATDRRARRQLWENVRAGKEMLSRTVTTQIHLPLLELDVPLGRETLDELAAPVIGRTVETVGRLLRDAGVDVTDLAAILLAGGASRMPVVSTALHRAFGIVASTVDQPELAVAEGSLRVPVDRPASAVAPQPPPAQAPASAQAPAGQVGSPARPDRTRVRRIGLIGLATVVALGVLAVGATALSARDDNTSGTAEPTPTPDLDSSPTPSPSPSYPPGVDPCLLGAWRIVYNTTHGLIDGERVPYVGGADTLLTYAADNTYTFDYAETKPVVATYGGDTYASQTRGTATLRYDADGTVMLLSMVSDRSTGELRRNGTVIDSQDAPFFLEPQEYRCTAGRLLVASSQGNYTFEAVRITATAVAD
ncbi:Hsp70 family protein [Solwaraspora sp. WMMA2056]|uniref:Hsp70 family protein n=1 Tax=Solwaraspora sp. WMMA2056 TaxID=3015161 RepID=UPI00259BAFBB|nr:Hsp70 family protein [Solwaraspora sp. WMMA2056]WJK38301.1 Hsp70 family protein [Solwaraspora sp. WMMA2056]